MAKKKPYRMVIYLFARALAAILYLLPRRWLLVIARMFGQTAYYVLGHYRTATLQNLRLAYGNEKTEAEIRWMTKQMFIHLAQTGAETLQFPKLNSEKVERFVEIGKGYDTYSKLLSEGNGLIALTSHIGNWELLGGVFTMKGYEGKAIARRVRYEPFNRWIESLRDSVKMGLFYRDGSPKEIIKWLNSGKLLGILPDQDIASVGGIFVNFFDRPAYTPVAPVKLALATKAPILTIFLIRMPKDRYQVVLGDIIRPEIKTTREAAILEYTQLWTTSCEKVIKQYPEQWGWLHNRWKTTETDLNK